MAGSSSSQGPASFLIQANALLRKNLTFQKRNYKTNAGLVTFPLFLCILMVVIQNIANKEFNRAGLKCGCICTDTSRDGKCAKTECGIQYSDSVQAVFCPISKPPTWPVLSTVPQHENRAVRTESIPFSDLPDESCRSTGSCPATTLFTGGNQSFGQSLAENFYASGFDFNSSDILNTLADFYLGTYTDAGYTNFVEPGFTSDSPVYVLQPQCLFFPPFSVPIQISSMTLEKEVRCLRNLQLWRGSSSIVNDEIFKGYIGGNSDGNINEIVAAYDFLNSDKNNFNVTIWYNSTNNNGNGQGVRPLVRAPRLANVVSNAYLRFLRGSGVKMLFDFVKEMPKLETRLTLDFTSVLGPLFFTWVVLQLFPVVMTSLVYEKQQNLRIMMKMHGLGDGPYWMISYAYFFFLSLTYMLCFVVFGSIIGLKFFTSNDYSIQFVFYFIYANLQIALAFLVSTLFSNFKIATVMGHIYVFGSGLLGAFLFQFFVQETSFPRVWIVLMEMFPGFSLYRGLYEFGQSARADGMRWRDLNDSTNGMSEVLLIMFVEWFIILPVAYYFDQVVSIGSGVRKHPLFFLKNFQKKRSLSFKWSSWGGQGSKVSVRMEKSDVSLEREKVKQLLLESSMNYAIISDDLKKMYPGEDGNPGTFAVKGMSLALPQGECFGMLGPNGAGKTSFINMMIGLVPPSSGTAFIHGMDIRTDMDKIYTSMGVCPQHDLLWETLTGREHLLFYGRLKNLKGVALAQAVEESLRSVNLFHGGVGDKRVGKYSGGMKRRLSVATSLIGDPKVVYMDEPSTGLDPASRNNLWNVVKRAKQDRAIILTTHSMEEAEVLCDRLGIFVDGSLQCIGNPKELKARYGGSYVFTMTTSVSQEKEVEKLVKQLSSSANRIYHISGTQKFELRKDEVRIADIFQAVANAKEKFIIHAWGLADTTLEDVFIKVAQVDQAFNQLS